MSSDLKSDAECERSLLLVEDDEPLRTRLAKAMERKGYKVFQAGTAIEGIAMARSRAPAFAVVDLRLLENGNGLDVVSALREMRRDARIIVLTGYGNIASAVAAIKAGAVDYLSKPADADAIEASLQADKRILPLPPIMPMSAERVRWEHIQRIYEQCGHNISETARRLRMHRRTLQRILSKRAPKERDKPIEET
ncbi:MAG: ActR/PrrA/RegA family redox response regulator transcription factor [Alphaproteobacteria bacterium]|nr:MAG: ActR/PrrA/RegA family redox response regulator transcription factor [Alphaproteobacteria bacterium]